MRCGCLRMRLAVAVACTISLVAFTIYAADAPSLTAEQAWQRLKDGNERFAAGQSENKDLGAARRQELTAGQRPFAAVLSCSDSRLPPEIIFNQGLGASSWSAWPAT